jgi:hypothetical protein
MEIQAQTMASMPRREPWNKGKLIGQKPPLRPKHVSSIRTRLQMEGRTRDLAMFNLAIDSELRACDLVRLQVHDICVSGQVRGRTTVIQRKTGQPVQFEISEPTRASIRDWLPNVDTRHGRYLFPSLFRAQPHLSTRQYARSCRRGCASAGLDSSAYGTHSMRRTKAAQIYKKTGNLRAVSAFARTHEARKHCPLPQHRGRGRAQHLRAGRTLTYIGALPWRGARQSQTGDLLSRRYLGECVAGIDAGEMRRWGGKARFSSAPSEKTGRQLHPVSQ